MRILLSTNSGKYTARTETLEGKEYLVVPVVAMVEGVVHAVNSEHPELVTAGEFSRNLEQWEGRPLFHGHPMREGEPVPSTHEGVMDEAVGIVRNAVNKGDRLAVEAWIDVERCTTQAPRLLERVQAEEAIEISMGAFVDVDDSAGQWRGKQYRGAWTNLRSDHLALLPEGDEGACSRKAGCGIRAAIQKGEAVSKKIDKTNGGVFARMMQAARNVLRPAQDADEMSSGDLSRRLFDELKKVESDLVYVDCFHPVVNPTKVVYSVQVKTGVTDWGGYDYKWTQFERDFELSADGVVTLGASRIEVEPVTYYEPVKSTDDDMRSAARGDQQKNAASGAPCSCKHEAPITPPAEGDEAMKREDVLAFLKDATAEDLKALGVTRAATEQPATETVQPPAAPVTPPAAPKAQTFEEVLASAPSDVQEVIKDGVRTAAAKKTATIAELKATGRNLFSDEELGAMSQVQLDRLVALAGKPRAAVDFGGQGAPKTDAPTDAPASIDMTERLKAAAAARAKK